jgi:hypothetical protein
MDWRHGSSRRARVETPVSLPPKKKKKKENQVVLRSGSIKGGQSKERDRQWHSEHQKGNNDQNSLE